MVDVKPTITLTNSKGTPVVYDIYEHVRLTNIIKNHFKAVERLRGNER